MSELQPAKGYQRIASARIQALKRTLLKAPMGSGKTRIVIDAFTEMGIFESAEPVLILGTKGSAAAWCRQLPLWTENFIERDDICIMRDKPPVRREMWKTVQDTHLITLVTYDTFLRDFKVAPHYKHVILDECQRYRNRKTKAFTVAKKVLRNATTAVQVSGTPARRGPQDLWTYLHALWPTEFRSYWKWVQAFCLTMNGEYGVEIIGVKNTDNLHKILRRMFVQVTEEEVADEMPEGKRQMVFLDMTPKQRKAYENIRDEMIHETESGHLIVTPTVLAQITRLRQLLVCPRILGVEDDGAGIEDVMDRLVDDPHVAIFTPFTDAIPHITRRLLNEGCDISDIHILRGGMEPEQVLNSIARFEETQGVMICSLMFAASWSLSDCKTSHFLGYDWTVDMNNQAEDRTRRVDSTHEFITWNYMRYEDTIDDRIMDTLIEHQVNLNRTFWKPSRQELLELLGKTEEKAS